MEVRPGCKQTEIGVIPAEWVAMQLCEVANLQVGFAFKSEWFGKTVGTRLLRGENVSYGRADWSETRTLKTKPDSSFRAYLLTPGDIVIGMDRTFTKTGSKITILCDEDCPCLLVQRVGRFIPRRCDNRFLWFVLSSEQVQSRLRLEQKGMDIPHLSRREILRPLAAFPPLPEQRAIATALSDVDALQGGLDQLIAKKRDIKLGAMQELLSGKRRLPGFSGEWEVLPFDAVFRRVPTKNYQIQTTEYQQSGKYPVIDQGQSAMVGYSDCEDKVFRVPDSGIVVFGDHTCIVKFVCNDFVVGADGTQILVTKSEQHTAFHAYCLMYKGVEATGYNRHFKFLKERLFQAPPFPEQFAIATILSDMDAEIAALESRLDKTRLLKQAMMQELLTGRIRLA